MISIHPTKQRLRALVAHLDRFPKLPPVRLSATSYDFESGMAFTIDGDTTSEFLAWAVSLGTPRVQVCGKDSQTGTFLRCQGMLQGRYDIRVDAFVDDLPWLEERNELMPLAGFRHMLKQRNLPVSLSSDPVTDEHPNGHTPSELQEMRACIDDSSWTDLEEAGLTAADLDDDEVLDGIERHYEGGLDQWRKDSLAINQNFASCQPDLEGEQ